jgi:phosphoribosylformimino-5-aminoimidazole carboxamide ribotide isomerase
MLIIPAIDLRAGKCVRLTQGRRDSTRIYYADPIAVALHFEAEGAGMLHLVDLDGAFSEDNSRNRAVLREIIRNVNVPVQFGGGLRSLRQVKEMIDLGVTRVVIGTLVIEAPELLTKMLHLFGSRHIAVGIDAQDGQVVMHGWETKAEMSAITLARKVASMGAERIIYTDVQRDGTLTGPNIKQTCKISSHSGLKVTASGGVSSLEDLKRLKEVSDCGIDSVIVGKALYEGRFTFSQARQALLVGP